MAILIARSWAAQGPVALGKAISRVQNGVMKKRLSHAERHQSIVRTAAVLFADNGLDGTTTKQIAAAARVSPALLYEHFPSKAAIYRAVLRHLIRQQDALIAGVDASLDAMIDASGGSGAILGLLQRYYGVCVFAKERQQDVTAHRLFLASIGSDGTFARLLYRRTLRKSVKALERALSQARQAGDIVGPPLSAQTAFCFIEHVGSMLLSAHLGPSPVAPYGETGRALVQQAVLFCGRGLGFTNESLNQYLSQVQRSDP